MNDPRGSLWRKWDLHVHTPCSLHHHYGGDTPEAWERFIAELEALPPEFSVLGINDYLFLDGYRKVLEFRNQGRLRNIATILPVLEFRIDKFGGTDGNLRRVNLHVIFSDELTSDQIDQQFLGSLKASYKLSPEHSNATWSGTITRDSLRDLGSCIISSVPPERRHEFGSPLIEGFNNLNLNLDRIHEALESTYLKNKHLIAVGKTEWSSLKWNDQSIAEKKHVINCAHLIFVAASNPDAYTKSRKALIDNGVNSKLLDCSDSHNWTESKDKDRIGRCDTWIRADPTFRGLQHALLEFEDRVFVGSMPSKLAELRSGAHRHIERISIKKKTGSSLNEHWFHAEIPLNPGLVAVIGNKGSGKSALADIIALGGNSAQRASFSFLSPQKFCRPRDNKAEQFEAVLRWHSGEAATYLLSRGHDAADIERVKYIPQSHLEALCNELSSEGNGAFEAELRQVIFSHIPAAERLNKPNLDTLLTFLNEGAQARLAELRGELSRINRQIADTEEDLSPEHKREIEKKLAAKLRELDAHNSNKPHEVPKPDTDPEAQQAIESARASIEAKRGEIATLEKLVETARTQRKEVVPLIATVDKILERISNLEARFRDAARESESDLQALGMQFESIAKLEVNTAALKERKAQLAREDAQARKDLDPSVNDSPQRKLVTAREALVDLQNRLDTPTRRYEEYLTSLKQWKDAGQLIQSDKDSAESIDALRAELSRIAELPKVLGDLEAQRMATSKGIFTKLSELKEQFRHLYRSVQDFIDGHKSLASSISLSFDVRISDQGFLEEAMTWLHQGRAGSFQGSEDGPNKLKLLLSKHSFDSVEATESFLTEFMQDIRNDNRSTPSKPVSTKSQLKSNKGVAEFYDFVFGLAYAKPRYALKMDGKEIAELSPGERGLLLLLFYLLVEKSEVPLVIDQPEENLDNETIHDVLVPAIRLAKQRRQVIIVTHNPNMAVVSDADQIIATAIDKQDGYRVRYESGALENPHVNQCVVRYLEGTMPAFMNRDGKYLRGK